MKVIVAAMPKTGTKSMVCALTELGYEVYDSLEHFAYHGADWAKIMNKGGSTEDFRRMYKNVDAVTDIPAAYYWEEIHKAFPNAKIILMQRDSDEVWWQSASAQAAELMSWSAVFAWFFSPTMRKLRRFVNMQSRAIFGANLAFPVFGKPEANALQSKLTYRRHNAHVLQNAPKDKLLVYSVKEGWAPLCEFLGKEMPTKPFPHLNQRGTSPEEVLKNNPVTKRVEKEILMTFSFSFVLLAYCLYKIYMAESLLQLGNDVYNSVVYMCNLVSGIVLSFF